MPPTRGKSFSGGNTKGLLNPLIPFNVIVDTDYGLLALIKKEYRNDEVFDLDFLDSRNVTQIVRKLYERREINPLSICIREDYKDMADDFYAQFMEREYDKILHLSVTTELYRVVGAYARDSEIIPTLVCDTEEELDILSKQKNTKLCDIVLTESQTAEEISGHHQFYFKSLYDMTPYLKFLKFKTIYLANYGFNRNEDNTGVVENEISLLAIPTNMLRLADIYNVGKLMEGEE